jgi:hypothetical protein
MPSAGLLGPQDLQKLKNTCQTTAKAPSISTRQADGGIPLFFWRNDLFFRTKSSLFACISCTLLWYWVKSPSSLDCNMPECFLALLSSFSSDFAQSTVSSHPWSMLDFCPELPTTSCTRQQSLSSTQFLWNSLLKGPVTYLHPLFSPAHRLHVTGHHRRVDKVIRQKLQPATTSCRCL